MYSVAYMLVYQKYLFIAILQVFWIPYAWFWTYEHSVIFYFYFFKLIDCLKSLFASAILQVKNVFLNKIAESVLFKSAFIT